MMDLLTVLREEVDTLREEVIQLKALIAGDSWPVYRGLKLELSQRILLDMLNELDHATAERIVARIQAITGRENVSLSAVKVQVSRLRTLLAALDPPIRILDARGVYYYSIPKEDKLLLDARRVT